MPGILAYGSYLPYYRLARSEIGAALGTTAGPGARAVAGYDEDTTSMAVEAGRAALAAAGPDRGRSSPSSPWPTAPTCSCGAPPRP